MRRRKRFCEVAAPRPVERVEAGPLDLPAAGGASSDTLMQRVQTLTSQQARVLGLVCKGRLNKQIAWELGVTEATVKAHVSAVLMKLGVDSRAQAAVQIAAVGVALLTGMPMDG